VSIVGILLSLLAKSLHSWLTELVGSALTLQRATEAIMYQRTILVVDDEPLIRMVLADCLADEGYAVLEASNVLEAVAVLGRHRIDALITDVDMPGALNGFDLVRLVASYGAGIAVIVTSGGHAAPEIEAERVCFLAKPYRLENILIELKNRLSPGRYPTPALAG
jgi:DNA-binding NtrC family response regulator